MLRALIEHMKHLITGAIYLIYANAVQDDCLSALLQQGIMSEVKTIFSELGDKGGTSKFR